MNVEIISFSSGITIIISNGANISIRASISISISSNSIIVPV